MDRTTRYPYHLAKLVTEWLREKHQEPPPERVLTKLLEILYFASLKTDEGRRVFCSVDYVDPEQANPGTRPETPADQWSIVPFHRPLPLDVRTLAKIARAADPEVCSLAVFSDRKKKLFIWGMVDQEPRFGETITLDSPDELERPGLFQATITGPGSISVFHHCSLVGSLVQNALVQEHHNVLWSGPVHAILKANLDWSLANRSTQRAGLSIYPPDGPERDVIAKAVTPSDMLSKNGLLLRWVNSLSRILVNIQRYRHGGGLLIVPGDTLRGLHIKYELNYDRLFTAITRLATHQSARGRALNDDKLRTFYGQLDEHKSELLGTVRFIASLASVDGVVLLDRAMAARGFGVELRAERTPDRVLFAGDASGSPDCLREIDPTQYGTRHRAMMRYCFTQPGALGFVISRDGNIQAMTLVGHDLVLWESIDLQLAFAGEGQSLTGETHFPFMRRYYARAE